MSILSDILRRMEYDLSRKDDLTNRVSSLETDLLAAMQEFRDLEDSQKLLSTISDENTARTLDYITGVINKALSEIFNGDHRRISLSKNLHSGRYAHINVNLVTKNNFSRDLDLQTGSGVKEVVSFLFTVCLIAVRGGRRLLIMDELLSGLHADAKAVMAELMGVFCEEGFQFICVEYGLENHRDQSFGKIINVRNTTGVASLELIPNGEYSPSDY